MPLVEIASERISELRAMPYKAYLLTEEWKGIRKKALALARHRCQVCDSDSEILNVHHKTYRTLGREDENDLIVLCEPCHKVFHRERGIERPQASLRLEVDPVPRTCWYSSVRQVVSQSQWNRIRRVVYRRANYCCDACGRKAEKGKLRCSTVWYYDPDGLVQRFDGFIALCSACSEVKHFGIAQIQGDARRAFRHLMKVNSWSREQAEEYLDEVFEQWREMSRVQWELDLSNFEKDYANELSGSQRHTRGKKLQLRE